MIEKDLKDFFYFERIFEEGFLDPYSTDFISLDILLTKAQQIPQIQRVMIPQNILLEKNFP